MCKKDINGISVESLKIAIALDTKKKLEEIQGQMKEVSDMFKVADLYEDMAKVVRESASKIKDLEKSKE